MRDGGAIRALFSIPSTHRPLGRRPPRRAGRRRHVPGRQGGRRRQAAGGLAEHLRVFVRRERRGERRRRARKTRLCSLDTCFSSTLSMRAATARALGLTARGAPSSGTTPCAWRSLTSFSSAARGEEVAAGCVVFSLSLSNTPDPPPPFSPGETRLTPPPLSPPHSHELSTSRTFTQADVSAFTSLTGDANPIHATRKEGTGTTSTTSSSNTHRPVVPGLLTASLFPALVGTAWPGAVYARQALRFVGVVGVGEGVVAVVRVDRVRRRGGDGSRVVSFKTTATRGAGGEVVVEGEALAVLSPSMSPV